MYVDLNRVFEAINGSKRRRWKVVINPGNGEYALVRDHNTMMNGECTSDDLAHLAHCKSLEDAYCEAVKLTK